MFSRVPPPTDQGESSTTDIDEKKANVEDIIPTNENCDGDKPKHVPHHLWEKFKALEKRTDDATRNSTERRMKHLKRQIVETVQEEITHPDDVDILRAHDVKFGPRVDEPTKKSKGKRKAIRDSKTGNLSSNRTSQSEEWNEVKQYLNVNEHLHDGTSKGHSKLELEIDKAVIKGDYSRADELNDQLANREFGTKIAHAFDARDFVKRKKDEEAAATAKKKKKLNWGFDHKQRWEMKSNM